MAFYLDSQRMERLPAVGGYSGYNPQRDRVDEKTLTAIASFDWGLVAQDSVLVLEAGVVPSWEYEWLEGLHQASDVDGLPVQYLFDDGDHTFTVEIAGLDGHWLTRDLRAGVRLELRVIEVLT